MEDRVGVKMAKGCVRGWERVGTVVNGGVRWWCRLLASGEKRIGTNYVHAHGTEGE